MKNQISKSQILFALAAAMFGPSVSNANAAPDPAPHPNILIILADDLGYADVGFQGCKDIPTPNLDRLASDGLRFSNGYVSAAYCSPSRAGLLTGRNQARFGHDENVWYDPNDHREGLPMTETLLPQFLKKAGYVTGWIGKWHLGTAPEFRPENRGFMETFGFLGGGHHYISWKPIMTNIVGSQLSYFSPILRNGHPVTVTNHLTIAFGNEGAAFIRRHEGRPWFLYFAPNAPHNPLEPTAERLAKFKSIDNYKRRKYAAQISLLDDAVGDLMTALHQTGQDKRTLVFFLSDNGGPLGKSGNGSSNLPLRAGKGTVYEGGMHVPFVMRWPGTLPADRVYAKPVSSLDIFPTALALAGVSMPTNKIYDGVNLMPYLTGKNAGAPNETLFWHIGSGRQTAIRDGDAKIVHQGVKPAELYNLSNDIGETTDLANAHPDELKKLVQKLDAWNKPLPPPAFPGLAGHRKKPVEP